LATDVAGGNFNAFSSYSCPKHTYWAKLNMHLVSASVVQACSRHTPLVSHFHDKNIMRKKKGNSGKKTRGGRGKTIAGEI
jgi:hypothetical protein